MTSEKVGIAKTGEISLAKWLDAEMGIYQISLDIANVELKAASDVFLVFVIKNPRAFSC